MKRLFSRAPLLGVVIPAWGVEDYLNIAPAELKYACMEGGLLRNTLRGWYGPDGGPGGVQRC